MRRHDEVFCNGCACLFIIKGEKPLCVATGVFVGGPLRRKIDVVGIISAEKRNAKNDCDYHMTVSRQAWEIKRWLLGRMRNDVNKVEAGNLADYTIEEEARQKNKLKVNEDQKQSKKHSKKKPEFPKGSPGEGTYNDQGPETKSPAKTRKRK